MRSVALFVVITIPGAQHHLESERHSRRSMIVVSNGSSNVFDDLTYACLSCCCACDCSGYDDMPLQPAPGAQRMRALNVACVDLILASKD